jgi:hypothetical protein
VISIYTFIFTFLVVSCQAVSAWVLKQKGLARPRFFRTFVTVQVLVVVAAAPVGNVWREPVSVLWGRLAANRDAHLRGRFDLLPSRCDTCQDWMVGTADKIRPRRGVFAR